MLNQLYYLRDLLRSKTARAFSLVVVANFAVTLLGFASSILLFRSQSTELISTIFPLVGLFLFLDQISDLGLSVAYIRFASADAGKLRFHRTTSAAFQARTVLATAFVIAAVAGAGTISEWLFHSQEQRSWIVGTALCAWLYSLSNFFQCTLQALGRFRQIAWVRIIPNLVKAGTLLTLVLTGNRNFLYYFAAFMMMPTIALFASLPGLEWKSFRPRRLPARDFRRLFGFSRWIFVSSVAVACISQLDLFMLKSMLPDADVVRFLGGQRLASVLPLLISSMVTILLPKVSSIKTIPELRFFVRKALLVSPVIFCLVLSFSFAAPFVIPLALGEKYQASVGIFQAYCWVYSVDAVITLVSLFVYNLRLVHWFSAMNFVQLALNYGLNLVLIPRYGAYGACATAALIRLAGVPMLVYLIRREKLFDEGAT